MNKGLSLIEVVITIGITAIIVSSCLSSVPRIARHQRLCGETKRLQNFLERARTRAVSLSSETSVLIRPSELNLVDAKNNLLEKFVFHDGFTIRTTSNIKDRLSFYSSHTASPATITVALRDLTAALVISLRGRIRVTC